MRVKGETKRNRAMHLRIESMITGRTHYVVVVRLSKTQRLHKPTKGTQWWEADTTIE